MDLAEATEDLLEDTTTGMYLTFHLGKEEYGLEIKNVIEIIGVQKITLVPNIEECIKGVINLRGKVIPVMDVRLRFGMEPREYDDRTCTIVVSIDDSMIGLIVDRVEEVLNISESQIQPPPDLGQDSSQIFAQGLGKVGDKVKILLDAKKLLYEQREALEALSNAEADEASEEA